MVLAVGVLVVVLQYSSSTPADDPLKLDECRRAGAAIKHLLEKDIKPRDIMTRAAFENAMVSTTGRRTGGELGLPACLADPSLPR